MQEHFRLGIFTSATQRTVGNVLPLLEQAAGPGTPLFADPSLILHRSVGLLPWNLPTCLPSSCAEQSMQSCHSLRCIDWLPSVCFGIEKDTMQSICKAASVVTNTLMHTVLAWVLKLQMEQLPRQLLQGLYCI